MFIRVSKHILCNEAHPQNSCQIPKHVGSTTLGTTTCFGRSWWPSSSRTRTYRVAIQQIQYMWAVFLGVGKGFPWDRDLVCVSGGCMVWNSIISLFMPKF